MSANSKITGVCHITGAFESQKPDGIERSHRGAVASMADSITLGQRMAESSEAANLDNVVA